MNIKFWGTRGSIPVAEPGMMKYGGNTACVEARLSSGTLLIFDAGTGIRRLGLSLMNDPSFEKKGHIFISHCHWDHIQGFPFFIPAFLPEYSWTIYGQFKLDGRLEDLLRRQMEHLYFPVTLEQMGAGMKFVEIIEEDFYIGGAKITSRHLNHPQGNMGFRVEDKEGIFVYTTDTEHYQDHMDPKILELAANADILVYDGQYTEEEYNSHVGWGHSTWKAGIKIAKTAGVKKLILFHHDPTHDDTTIDRLIEQARREFPETYAAERDMQLVLNKGDEAVTLAPTENIDKLEDRISRIDNMLYIRMWEDSDVFNSSEFSEAVARKLTDDLEFCIFDFKDLQEIDSCSLGTLAKFYEKAKNLNIKVKLTNVSKFVREVLEITRFTGLVEIQ